MDGSRFDAWTRRRFGLTSGALGLGLGLLGLGPLDDAEAKKRRKKKKKCRKLDQTCKTGGKKKKCCKNLLCEDDGAGQNRCCKDIAIPCASFAECCSNICLDGLCQPVFCKVIGEQCGGALLTPCCSGLCDTTGGTPGECVAAQG